MGIKEGFTEKYFCNMFSRLLGKKGKKKQTLQELTAFMNPGRQRLRELKSIKEAALQRTLTNLQKNVERRSQKLPPISEVYSPSKSDKRSMTAMVKTDLSGVKLLCSPHSDMILQAMGCRKMLDFYKSLMLRPAI